MKFKKGDRVVVQDRTLRNFGRYGTVVEYDTHFTTLCSIRLDNDEDKSWRYDECQLGRLYELEDLVCDYMDARDYATEPHTIIGSSTFNIKEFEELFKKEKKEMELLNIYFDKKQKEIKEKYREKGIKIKSKDPVYKELNDIAKKYDGVRGVVCYIGCDFEYNDEIRKALVKNDRDCDVQIDDMYALKKEIIAQLEVCETYEQKMNILKAYGVVNENGILNK